MKKVLALALVLCMVLGLAACGGNTDTDGTSSVVDGTASTETGDVVKIGVILLHDEFSTYDLNFINGVEDAKKELGLSDDQIIMKKNIPESDACYEAACDLVDEGCDIIFADSFGHET